MLASIIILNWNGGIADCVEAIDSALSQDYPNCELIFVDNGSSDGSPQHIAQRYDHIELIQLDENIGCPAGRNVGAQAAKGEILFFLENDGCWDDPQLVSKAMAFFAEHQDIGAAYTSVEGYHTGVKDPALEAYVSDSEISLASAFRGGAAIVRANLFQRFGGFPADFFRQGEERYLALQIYNAGFKIVYLPHLRMRHKGSDYQGKQQVVSSQALLNTVKTQLRLYPAPAAYLSSALSLASAIISGLKKRDMSAVKFTLQNINWRQQCQHQPKIDKRILKLVETMRFSQAVWINDYRAPIGQLINQQPLYSPVKLSFSVCNWHSILVC